MSANYDKYDENMKKAQELMDRYKELDNKLQKEMDTYKSMAQDLTGEKGVQKAMETGTKLAQQTAGQAVTQAQASARQSGMSKAASAMMGANQSANQYANNLQNSMNTAYNANQDSLNTQNTNVNNAQKHIDNNNSRVGQYTGMANQEAQKAQAQQDQIYRGVGTATNLGGQLLSMGAGLSDERMKDIFGETDCGRITDLMSKINAIEFKYTDEAQDKYDGNFNVDDDVHLGISAQELEKNPLTENVVEINENGDRVINGVELTAVNTASISALAKEISELKDMVWKLQHKHDDEHMEIRKEYEEMPHDEIIEKTAHILKDTNTDFLGEC